MSLPAWVGKIRKNYAVTEQLPLYEFRLMAEALSIALEALEQLSRTCWCHDRNHTDTGKCGHHPMAKEALRRIEEMK